MKNTTRNLFQCTYTPIKLPNDVKHSGNRGLEKCALLRQLSPSVQELKELKKKANETIKKAIDVIIALLKSEKQCAKILAGIDQDVLSQISYDLVELRKSLIAMIRSKVRKKSLAPITSKENNEKVNDALKKFKENIEYKQLHDLIFKLSKVLKVDLSSVGIVEFVSLAHQFILSQEKSIDGFKQSLKVEPVGYLHLERLSFTPIGTECGELVHSVPLAPGEVVNITHREWSNTSEEFESIVNDYMEEYSETGVAEKSELSQSVNSQKQHSTAFNTGVTASGGYGGVTITTSAGYNINDSNSESATFARNNSSSITQKSSSRVKKEHKMSFRVASASEIEDQTVQTIKNPYLDRATRVDYFQLIRKWQVDLYRYGVRLTWDLAIPEPGSALLSKMKEIERIRDEIEQGFDSLFELKATEITRDNYINKAADYGVSVNELPPSAEKTVIFTDSKNTLSQEKYIFDFEVPENYKVKSATLDYFENHQSNTWGIHIQDISGRHRTLFANGSGWHPAEVNNYNGWNGMSGKLFVHVNLWDIKFYTMTIRLQCELKEFVYDDWKQRTWETIRSQFRALYLERRQMLSDRLERLEDELGTEDALSLRKKEREEVMKGFLRWIGIEDFVFYPEGTPSNVEDDLYDPDSGLVEDTSEIAKILGQGEVTKFLHHAIEWENMVYFLYPYFWTHARRWKFKRKLDHPDPMHKAFLKSGSARVVLTIRPGFENAFMAFLNTGDFNEMPPSPYLEIGEELKNFANTNYPGIPPANPVNNSRPLLYPEQRKAWADMNHIMTLLDRYSNANNGTYPSTSEGLTALDAYTDPIIPTVPNVDPWENPYKYKSPGMHGEYDLSSLGANGEVGGEGHDADINSWAEASHIGQWYEYTPTSALDITFND